MGHNRWDFCLSHRGADADRFVESFFEDLQRRVLLLVGAGFDPRSTAVCHRLSRIGDRIEGVFLREERPGSTTALTARAEANLTKMRGFVPKNRVEHLNIFASDGAVIGGREVIRVLGQLDLSKYTDVVVDISSLSIGIAYPAIKYLYGLCAGMVRPPNLHLLVVDSPGTDSGIQAVASDRASCVLGFQDGFGLDENINAVRLWLPLLQFNKSVALQLIYSRVRPSDTCPVLPFPSSDPSTADRLIEHYLDEFESAWQVDPRNIVYAHERHPLDVYRTILQIADARQRVFENIGGSMLVLSPLGNKAMAAGMLMSAIERDFPVVYVEAVGYDVNFDTLDRLGEADGELVHVWLEGEPFPRSSSVT